MAHGTPDWGISAGAVNVYQVTDMGELAVRLGSIDGFDRRGDVLFLDSFENGLAGWDKNPGSNGGVTDLSISKARSGLFSARIVSAAVTNDNPNIARYVAYPVVGPFGVEFAFHSEDTSYRLELIVNVRTEGWWRQGWIYYRRDLSTVTYVDLDGNEVEIASGLTPIGQPDSWYNIKLVIDPENAEYVRLLFNDQVIDMSGIALRPGAGVKLAFVLATIGLRNVDATARTVNVDDVIVTQNEPL